MVAALLLVMAVLPAEYGLDPTGVGQALGLTALASEDAEPIGALTDHLDAYRIEPDRTAAVPGTAANAVEVPSLHGETLRFELGPFESVEYKYRLAAGDSLLYRWHSTAVVLVNFHSEPDNADAAQTPAGETAVSFNQGRSRANYGAYVAPFDGIHGWFWQNRGAEALVIELQTHGFFRAAVDYRGGFPFEKTFAPTR